jgi:hypothetical protein
MRSARYLYVDLIVGDHRYLPRLLSFRRPGPVSRKWAPRPPQSHAAISVARERHRNRIAEGGCLMTVVRSEWLAANNAGLENYGLESYTPPDRRASEKPSDADRIAFLHRRRDEPALTNDPAADNLNVLIRGVADHRRLYQAMERRVGQIGAWR